MLTIPYFADQPDSRIVWEMAFAIQDDDGSASTATIDDAYLVLRSGKTTIRKAPEAGSEPGILNFTLTNGEAGTLRSGRYNVVVVVDNVATRYADDDAAFVVEDEA